MEVTTETGPARLHEFLEAYETLRRCQDHSPGGSVARATLARPRESHDWRNKGLLRHGTAGSLKSRLDRVCQEIAAVKARVAEHERAVETGEPVSGDGRFSLLEPRQSARFARRLAIAKEELAWLRQVLKAHKAAEERRTRERVGRFIARHKTNGGSS